MDIRRIDFESDGDELTFIYDADEMTYEQAEHIIYVSNGYNDSITDKCKGFFLPTSKADLLKEWVNDFKNK